jgi:peptidoglycan hydrolase-like protein with peptidoglycan-binding domain
MRRILLPATIVFGLGIALGTLAAPHPLSAQTATEAAETAFWDSVKDSRDPAEVRAYLEKFPNGLFAPLAKIRLRNLEAAKTPAPAPSTAASTPPQQQSTSAPALTSESIIREVQDRLYNLNYTITTRNGRMNQQTRDAIRQWQTNVKQPVSGDMSVAQLALLRRAQLPTTWGSIAYFSKGASSTVWNRPTREIAEREALAACRKNAGAPCQVLSVANRICGALGFYNAVVSGKQHWGAYASVRPTLGQATDHALSECRRQAKQPNACGIRATVCADGSHRS